jgi:hypothetical protein
VRRAQTGPSWGIASVWFSAKLNLVISFREVTVTIRRLIVLAALVAPAPSIAHDLISDRFVAGEKAIADLQVARDAVLLLPNTSTDTKEAARGFIATAFIWDRPSLSVCFWQSDQPALLQAVIEQANLWSSGTRIRFDFGQPAIRICKDAQSADIRVTLKPLAASYYAPNDLPLIAWDWSEYGHVAADLKARVSMSLVHAPQYYAFSQTAAFNFVVAHEFGHALGLIHEHQRVNCADYLADKKQVMAAYGFKTDADYNTFVANLTQIPASDPALRPVTVGGFNIKSIMVYNFPQAVWKTQANNPCARPSDIEHPNQDDLATVNYTYGAPVVVARGEGGGTPSREQARKVLLAAYHEHTRLAAAPVSRGADSEVAAANREAAESIMKLLRALDDVQRVLTRARR